MSYIDDLYYNCRHCRFFDKGKCTHGNTFTATEIDVGLISEEGTIAEAIREGFSDYKFRETEMKLSSYLSGKRAKEVMKTFLEELEGIKNIWVEDIDSEITIAIQNAIDGSDPEIYDPDTFYCRYFD